MDLYLRYLGHLQNILHGPSKDDYIVAMDAYLNKVAIVWNNHIEICEYVDNKLTRRVQKFGGLLENDQGPDDLEVGQHFHCGKFFRNWFFAGTVSGTVEMYKVSNGQLFREFDSNVETSVKSLACSPTRISALFDQEIVTWNMQDGALIEPAINVHVPSSVMYHPNGQQMLVNCQENTTIRQLDGHNIVHTFPEFYGDAVYSPSGGHTVALIYRNQFLKFWNPVTHEFSNITIRVTNNNDERFKFQYIGKDKVLCIRNDELRVYYADTGILICKKEVENAVTAVAVVSNTILYSFFKDKKKKIHAFRLPDYNYSRMKTRRLQTGIIEGIAAARNHPVEENLDDSPVQDKDYYTRLFEAIRDTKSRQSQRTHQERRRRTMAADIIKRGWRKSRRRQRRSKKSALE